MLLKRAKTRRFLFRKAKRLNDSYLTGRSQVVDIDGVLSRPKDITCGVPQGSTLGSLLFLIYVNYMVDAVKCKLLLNADDSALMVSYSDVNII